MAREILVSCDPHKDKDGSKEAAEIALFAVRINDPNEMGNARTICGALDLCTAHQGFADELEQLVAKYGQPLDEKGRALLRSVISNTGTPVETGYRLCLDCKPPKLLKKNSVHTHASGVHDSREKDLNIRRCDSEGNVLPD